MADIINLRQVRKQKARSDREQKADANRSKFGRSKADKLASKRIISRDEALLDGHKLSVHEPDNDRS